MVKKKTKKKVKTTQTRVPAKKKFNWQRPDTWSFGPLATLGPVGYFPKGSGTVGALVALPIAYFASHISIYLLWTVTLFFLGAGLFAIQQFTVDKTEKDPGCVIVDEVVGQLVTFLVVIPQLMHWPMLFLGFALFRFFDIFKFGLVAYWDRRKNPVGVMMDDVTAGMFAGFVLAVIQAILVNGID